MPKIKCSHCGATNQDVAETDPCWQCGTALNAPVSAAKTEETAAPPQTVVTQPQLQKERDAPQTPNSMLAGPQSNKTAIYVVLILAILVIALLVFFLKH